MDMVMGTYERAVAALPVTVRRLSAGFVDALVPLVLLHQVPAPLWILPELERPWDILPRVWLLPPLAGYFALCSLMSHWRWGRTLGKQIFRLSVVREDGSRCPWSTLLSRELLRGASLVFLGLPFLPLRDTPPDLGIFGGFVVMGIYAVLFGAAIWIICPVIFWKRGLHDYVVATNVIGDVPRATAERPTDAQQYQPELVIVFMLVPVVLVVAAVSPNLLTFGGVLLGVYIAMDTYDRFVNGKRPPAGRTD